MSDSPIKTGDIVILCSNDLAPKWRGMTARVMEMQGADMLVVEVMTSEDPTTGEVKTTTMLVFTREVRRNDT